MLIRSSRVLPAAILDDLGDVGRVLDEGLARPRRDLRDRPGCPRRRSSRPTIAWKRSRSSRGSRSSRRSAISGSGTAMSSTKSHSPLSATASRASVGDARGRSSPGLDHARRESAIDEARASAPWRGSSSSIRPSFAIRGPGSTPSPEQKRSLFFETCDDVLVATDDEGLGLLAPEDGLVLADPAHPLGHLVVPTRGMGEIDVDLHRGLPLLRGGRALQPLEGFGLCGGRSVFRENPAASSRPRSTGKSGLASQFVIAEFIMPNAIWARNAAS